MQNKKKSRVLSICSQDNPCVRIGVNNGFNFLAEQDQIDFRYKNTFDVIDADLKWATIVIITRGSTDRELEIIRVARENQKFIIYFLDDDLLSIALDPNYAKSYEINKNLRAILAQSDILMTTSRHHMEKYLKYCPRLVIVDCPMSIRPSILNKTAHNKLRIGYGRNPRSDWNKDYFVSLIEPIIQYFSVHYSEQVEFDIIGFKLDYQYPNVNYYDYQTSYSKYEELMFSRQWDLGLAIIEDTEISHCKYINKFIEFTSFNILGVYSNIPPYKDRLSHKVNAILVDNKSDSFINEIIKLIKNREFVDTYRQNAQELLSSSFSYQSVMLDITKSIPEILTYDLPELSNEAYLSPNKNTLQILLNILKRGVDFRKIYTVLKREKLNFFKHVIKVIKLKY